MIGTRADFYVGRGREAEWLGSIAWDGYPEGIDREILAATQEDSYRLAVAAQLQRDRSATLPAYGWPWPWEDSRTTDYAYAFDEGRVWASCFGCDWFDPLGEESGYERETTGQVVFPNMKDRQNVTYGERSGLIILAPSPKEDPGPGLRELEA